MKTNETSSVLRKSEMKFILAAIEDINEHGVAGLSLRRVALRCGMTSGAPYRHFADKNELSLAVFSYINDLWQRTAQRISSDSRMTLRERIEELSIRYIRFLCDNPGFQTILMTNDSSMTEEQRMAKSEITDVSRDVVLEYCKEVRMDEDTRERKIFAVRAMIYTAALMINSGSMPYNDASLGMVRSLISREFDLA